MYFTILPSDISFSTFHVKQKKNFKYKFILYTVSVTKIKRYIKSYKHAMNCIKNAR